MTSDRDDELARYREYHERTVALLNRQAAELGAARARVAELEADLDKIEGFRADLAERCFRKDLELDELRARDDTPTPKDQP